MIYTLVDFCGVTLPHSWFQTDMPLLNEELEGDVHN